MKHHTVPGLLVCAALAACGATRSPASGTVRICTPDGCADRPADTETFRPSQIEVDPDSGARMKALEELARNDPRAAWDLGLRYFRGDGVRQDSYAALLWMREAGERGDLDAQKALGRFYLTGLEEMGSDPREAQKWLSIAAGRGDEESATLLREAESARRNDEEDYRWRMRWRPVFYRYWYSAYPYRWYWLGGWYLY